MSDTHEDDDILHEIEHINNLMDEYAESDGSGNDDDDNDGDVTAFKVYADESNEEAPRSCLESCPSSPESPSSVELVDILNANKKLIEAYKAAEAAIEKRLEECRKKRAEAMYQLQLIGRGGKANWKIPYVRAGMPYFKDAKFFPAPKNPDTIQKKKLDELSFVYTCRPRMWTVKSRNILNREVREQAAEKVLTKMKKMAETNQKNKNSNNALVPRNWTKFGKAGPSEYDWMKIATKDLKSKYSWTVCWAMWNLLLNDDINRKQWTEEEDNQLLKITKNHKYQDWDSIAETLATQRSGYQCFVRHGSLSRPMCTRSTDIPWSPMQDEILFKCVEHLRVGSFIPWGVVTSYIQDKTKNQVYSHWKYNLDPSLKKGRFSAEEDKIILNGVAEFGKNFPRIAAMLLPDRTSVQVSGRYKSLMLKTNETVNTWTIAEDQQLLTLHEELGPQWKCIADILNKDRTYVRHRYSALKRDLKRGLKLVSIKRKSADPLKEEVDIEGNSISMENNVDVQLVRYFQCTQTPPAKPGRKAKYHTADQLEIKTKMLADAFQKLQVTFTIPDDLDGYNLTEKDKQLLISVKNYMNSPRVSPEVVEEYRKKMFENNQIIKSDPDEHFSPSASFSFVRVRGRKRERAKIAALNSIDLPAETVNLDKINMTVTMELETPKNILEVLRDDEESTFKKLFKCISQTTTLPKYLLCKNFAAGLSKQGNIEEDTDDKNDVFIEPSHITLTAYKCLLQMKDNMKLGDECEPPEFLTNSAASRRAFRLLKTRFTQVFKYPIGLARTVPSKNHYISHTLADPDEDF